MNPSPDQSRPRRSSWSTIAAAAAVAACAACCAGPLLAVPSPAFGAAFRLGAVWGPALALVAWIPFAGALVLWRSRRTSRRSGRAVRIQLAPLREEGSGRPRSRIGRESAPARRLPSEP